MLPKVNRLNKKADFVRVSKKGQVVQSKNFGLAYLAAGGNEPPKFGFIVSNKISKKAVDRNRIKRILRQIIRELITEPKKTPPKGGDELDSDMSFSFKGETPRPERGENVITDNQNGLALSAANGLLLVLLARKNILEASAEELKRELKSKLEQIGALK